MYKHRGTNADKDTDRYLRNRSDRFGTERYLTYTVHPALDPHQKEIT
jgi:hypothetical protein